MRPLHPLSDEIAGDPLIDLGDRGALQQVEHL